MRLVLFFRTPGHSELFFLLPWANSSTLISTLSFPVFTRHQQRRHPHKPQIDEYSIGLPSDTHAIVDVTTETAASGGSPTRPLPTPCAPIATMEPQLYHALVQATSDGDKATATARRRRQRQWQRGTVISTIATVVMATMTAGWCGDGGDRNDDRDDGVTTATAMARRRTTAIWCSMAI
ncbi:hypothetical protein EDB84DRAFT_1439062 [Lactarius hengduanensis]|nr:hypothetical protein EDB84DRAFT_1439062 [Lactarius hengduanensis]